MKKGLSATWLIILIFVVFVALSACGFWWLKSKKQEAKLTTSTNFFSPGDDFAGEYIINDDIPVKIKKNEILLFIKEQQSENTYSTTLVFMNGYLYPSDYGKAVERSAKVIVNYNDVVIEEQGGMIFKGATVSSEKLSGSWYIRNNSQENREMGSWSLNKLTAQW